MILFNDSSSQFIVKCIYLSDSEGAHTTFSCSNSTTFGANSVKLIVGSTSIANFQLIVDLFLIPNHEGACVVPISHSSFSEGEWEQCANIEDDGVMSTIAAKICFP
jgi:hypothetical protein